MIGITMLYVVLHRLSLALKTGSRPAVLTVLASFALAGGSPVFAQAGAAPPPAANAPPASAAAPATAAPATAAPATATAAPDTSAPAAGAPATQHAIGMGFELDFGKQGLTGAATSSAVGAQTWICSGWN